ncbi:hypothetical protein [Flavivirga algicola]|uniref:Uncharacterized protein n=1 Tax=Flavivirga algicola TaxID=2729136 RepID=A0ABX1RW16_9FLAO|nr:hypothetical protein [Flavivirga algicola]NMH86404.1 hypothetical protein [Flavivirga algicola]
MTRTTDQIISIRVPLSLIIFGLIVCGCSKNTNTIDNPDEDSNNEGGKFEVSYKLENFEATNTVVRPSHDPSKYTHWEWGFDSSDKSGNKRLGTAVYSNAMAFTGNQSLAMTIDGLDPNVPDDNNQSVRNIFVQYYPYDDDNYEYRYIREQEVWKGHSGYQLNTYNRMRMWVKVPKEAIDMNPKDDSFQVGTYTRLTTADRNSSESGGNGGHFYHYFNLPYMGNDVWHQVIVDFHPHTERGVSGSIDIGVQDNPESGYNYFDLMTRYYLKSLNKSTSYPSTWYVDDIELYFDPNDENIEQVYALSRAYNRENNRVQLGWSRHKQEGELSHEVRYAFEDIHVLGWSHAKLAPNGVVTPPSKGSYNGMRYTSQDIDFEGADFIYIAIKPSNSDRFRQIKIIK